VLPALEEKTFLMKLSKDEECIVDRELEDSAAMLVVEVEAFVDWSRVLLPLLLLWVASARRLATPQTIPVASRGSLRRSSMIGTRISSFEPRRRLDSSSFGSDVESAVEEKKRGRRRFSRSREAAGSAAVRVRERKRGLSTSKVVVRASRRMEMELASLV